MAPGAGRRYASPLAGDRGEETIRRLRTEAARAQNPEPSPARRAAGCLLTVARARNWVTGLVIPIVAAVTVGIAAVMVAGANGGGGGAAPAPLSAGFPPARDASADFTGPGAEVGAVASAGGTEVAAGRAGAGPALWTSADGGSTWTRETAGETAHAPSRGAGETRGTGESEMTSVAHGAAGWLAVGGPPAVGGPSAGGGSPVVDGSADGRTWAAEGGEASFGVPGAVTSAAAAGPAGYVIVGRRTLNGQNEAAAWYSQGLAGWRPAVPRGDGDRQMNAVTATAKGFTAVGSAGNRPAAWRSANGRTWSEVTLPRPPGAARAELGYAAASGDRVTAAGTATEAGQPVPFTAVSADGGASWSLAMLPRPRGGTAARVTALTAAGGGFTAAGTDGQHVIVWTAGGSPSRWTEATPDAAGLSGPGTQEITALTSSGTTLTGVGFSETGAAGNPTLWQPPVRG